jgi:hypothetical protein
VENQAERDVKAGAMEEPSCWVSEVRLEDIESAFCLGYPMTTFFVRSQLYQRLVRLVTSVPLPLAKHY